MQWNCSEVQRNHDFRLILIVGLQALLSGLLFWFDIQAFLQRKSSQVDLPPFVTLVGLQER